MIEARQRNRRAKGEHHASHRHRQRTRGAAKPELSRYRRRYGAGNSPTQQSATPARGFCRKLSA